MSAVVRDLEARQDTDELVPTASGSFQPRQHDDPLASVMSMGPESSHLEAGQESVRGETEPLSDRIDPNTFTPVGQLPAPRVVPFRRFHFPTGNCFLALQKWEGIVLSVQGDFFTARLVDKTKSEPDEEAEIPLSDVTADDFSLVKPGAIFYWTIGYTMDVSRGRRRAADIRFRRLPAWTKRELEQARSDADRTIETLGWEE